MPTPIPGNPIEVRQVQTAPRKNRKVVYFDNEELYLAGIFPGTERLDGNFDQILSKLSTRRNNFFRQYITAYYLYDTTRPIKTPTGEDHRQRYSPFLWLSGDDPAVPPANRNKWDLTRFNENYFARLRRMLAAARAKNIVVQLTLFDGAGMRFLDRWPYHPWNARNNINGVVVGERSAMPAFYTGRDLPAKDSAGNVTTTLGKIQDEFLRQVVTRTLDFWNVVFEIMNEPTGGTPAGRAAWADTVTGVINRVTKGRRLIFYNDHSKSPQHPKGGLDVNAWRALPNYRALDGVIFHGDPNLFAPEQTTEWQFAAEKIIQASSDTYTEVDPRTGLPYRETAEWNRTTTNYLFGRHIVYQAEAGEGGRTTAADGIQSARPQPTEIKHAPFLGNWDKLSPTPPQHFYLRFDANGRYFAIKPTTDAVIDQGRIVRFTDTQFVTLRDGQTAEATWNYSVSPDGQQLSYHSVSGDPNRPFIYRRFTGDIEPFLYGWRRVGADADEERTPLRLYFRQDNTFATRDVQDPARVINYGRVITLTSDPPRMVIESTPINNLQTPFLYSFFDHGRGLRLFNERKQRGQEFARLTEGLPV